MIMLAISWCVKNNTANDIYIQKLIKILCLTGDAAAAVATSGGTSAAAAAAGESAAAAAAAGSADCGSPGTIARKQS